MVISIILAKVDTGRAGAADFVFPSCVLRRRDEKEECPVE
jgi:hypothetical protein